MFRILSIDGGGIKGVFPASFLAEIEKNTGKKTAEHFDLIAGTSTGGIIALGLGLGIPASEILKFYETCGPEIFKKEQSLLGIKFFSPKYDSKPLEKHLGQIFKDKKIGHSSTRLVIPSLNTKTGKPYVYKTAHHKKLHTDYQRDVAEAALSTASAPTFFQSFKSKNGVTFIDGGIWSQNPTLVSIIEALTYLGQKKSNVRVLSLGCTYKPFDYSDTSSWGKAQWALEVAGVFTASQSMSALKMSELLLKKEYIYRIDQINQGKKIELDDVSNIENLKILGHLKAREKFKGLEKIFFKKRAKKFEPIYKLNHHSAKKDRARTQNQE